MDKRYEFSFDEQINGGGKDELKGIVIDVCPKGCEPMASNKPMIIFQSEDKGKGHIPFGNIEFENMEDLELAKLGIEILQQAISRNVENKQ